MYLYGFMTDELITKWRKYNELHNSSITISNSMKTSAHDVCGTYWGKQKSQTLIRETSTKELTTKR
jgi:hypothetical protein